MWLKIDEPISFDQIKDTAKKVFFKGVFIFYEINPVLIERIRFSNF
jgi:hypothetical protein